MPDATPLPGSTLHALCVYAEPLVVGRRVVVFGDATLQVGERFLELGARLVHLYDPHAARAVAAAERAPRGLTVLALPAGDFDVRDGAFDLAVVIDVADVPAPGPLLSRVRRLLAPGGAALVRARSVPEARGRSARRLEALDYYELYDVVAMQFAHVRMVGQMAWSGVAIAELGRTGDGAEPDVTVDTQLAPTSSAPEAFIAVASQEDVRLAEYALVQLPPGLSQDDEEAKGESHAELAAAQLRASFLEAQVEELRAQRNQDGVSRAEALAAAEVELVGALASLQRAEARAADAAARAEEAATLLRGRDEALARLRDRATLAARELDDERRLRSKAEVELGATRAKLDALGHDAKAFVAAAARVPEFEAAIAELQAGAIEVAERALAAEHARAAMGEALAAAQAEVAALRAAQGHARAQSAADANEAGAANARAKERHAQDEARLAAAAARIGELEALVRALEARGATAAHDEGHGAEIASIEAALRDRAKVIAALEHELARRERIILDLVHALEEARLAGAEADGAATDDARTRAALADAEATLRDARQRAERARAEATDLREKLDAAALEIARREAEIETRGWRVQELEQAVSRLEDEQSELTMTIPPPAFLHVEREANDVTVLTRRLSAAEDEADLLRQALAQEHAARVRAESGDALTQARADLARQAALLETLSRELEAHDGVRREPHNAEESGAGTA